MKFFIMFFLFFISLYGAHIDEFAKESNYHRDYQTALLQAKDQNKTLMIVAVGDTCPWCRKFERKTLKQEGVDRVVKANFTPLIIDREHDEGKYPEKYRAKRVPTVYFIDPKSETKLYESMGYTKTKEYVELLVEVMNLQSEANK